ncbi:MAG TPA: creatininase family protein [Burkholderiaceae bacterium]|nr:creatininase family protein [Burkholderiaceae bacterium]
MNRWVLCTVLCLLASSAIAAEGPNSVFVEELTWTEVRDAINAGKTTIIFPTGGTEQNGPHMVLGKHNFIVKHAAEQIARRLGNALVAPVLAYVPEGNIDPPSGHMRYPGTISLPDEVFMKVTEYAARSFKANGFKDIVLIGDSGENQKGLQSVANSLNKQWLQTGVRVHFVPDYYKESPFREWLQGQGEKRDDIGGHAGIVDTSQLMVVNQNGIRTDKLAPGGDRNVTGVSGNPVRASVAYGKKGLEMKIDAAVVQIRKLIATKGAR